MTALYKNKQILNETINPALIRIEAADMLNGSSPELYMVLAKNKCGFPEPGGKATWPTFSEHHCQLFLS